MVDILCNDDDLIMNIHEDSEDKLLRTVNGIHPKGNLLRMADSPKFAKFKKKRLTKEPPLRIASSLPATPRCTSPSDIVSSEERKHMEIKLIEALALPMPNKNLPKVSKDTNKKVSLLTKENVKKVSTTASLLTKDNVKKVSTACIKDTCPKDIVNKPSGCPKRKLPLVEPIPSRLMPVVSKRQRNNLEKNKVKDPRLNAVLGNVDPRLNKADYGTKSNVIQLQNTNLIEINSSTNTATETVDDVGIIDMTIDHEKLPDTFILTPDLVLKDNGITIYTETTAVYEEEVVSETVLVSSSDSVPVCNNDLLISMETIPLCDVKFNESNELTVVQNGVISPNNDIKEGNMLNIVEFPSIASIEIKTEDVEPTTITNQTNNINTSEITIKEEVITSSGLIKPQKNYRKGLSNSHDDAFYSASEHESDDDDRAYNRKKSSRKSRISSNPKTTHPKSIKCEILRSSSIPRKTVKENTRRSSSFRSHSRQRSIKRSLSPTNPKLRSQRNSSVESSFSNSDRSDTESVDISNKLIELSNPVPYDIEHERKLRFLSGGASKGMGERKNIYAGGITQDTTKAELSDRFRRFGEIVKITLHFRDKGDNYAFIVFEDPDNAMRAIEEGNDDRSYPHLDLCFGGRRKFVGGSYVDFDGNNRFLEETDKANVNSRDEPEEDDFDRLLKMAMSEKRKREVTPTVEVKKEPVQPESPEWS